MAINIDDLPRDANGIAQGVWRALHSDRYYSGPLGVIEFVDGASVTPVAGRSLLIMAAMFGTDVYIEPWTGPVPDGFVHPPLVEMTAPGYTPEPCPWRTAPAAQKAAAALPAVLRDTLPPPPPEEPAEAAAPAGDVSLDDMDRDALEALAAELDVKVDGRWGDSKLRRAIRFAQR